MRAPRPGRRDAAPDAGPGVATGLVGLALLVLVACSQVASEARPRRAPPGPPIASDPNHLILNLAFGNDTDEFDWSRQTVRPLDGGLLGSARFPKPTVEWDYVRVWQPAGKHPVCTTGTC